MIVAGLLGILFIQGISSELTGNAGTPSADAPTDALKPGQTILSERGGRLDTPIERPGRRVALTFDDGPDPEWTPRILETLRLLAVPGTFFVVGDHAIRYPGIVEDEIKAGHEVGNHTFTHADLSSIPKWERKLQISLTDTAIAGAAGVRPRLIRPPYSATPAAVTKAQRAVYEELARDGYVIALSDLDGRDWERPGVAEIVHNATPPGKRGGIVLLHDGGGDRGETVAALKRLVPRLKQRGFRFVTLAQITGLQAADIDVPAGDAQSVRGDLLIATLTAARWITKLLEFLLIPIAALAIIRAIVLFVLARRHAGEYRQREHLEEFAPPVSILVPAFNEGAVIAPAVGSLAASEYPEFEVIVIDDGSADDTALIVERLELANVRVIRQTNAGKPAALNAGLEAARHGVIVTVDADTQFEPGTLHRLVQPFRDGRVGAVAGNTKVGNRDGMLGRWQHIDYVMSFNLDRRLYDVLDCMPTVPGAIGAFRREALRSVGDFSSATLAEDTDITIALGRKRWRVVYAEDALAFTEAPSSWSALWRQRYRWSYGTMQAVWKHRAAIVRSNEGHIGRIGLPYLIAFQVVLPLLAPFVDVFAVYGLVFLDPAPVLAYWLGFNILLLSLAAYAFWLDEEPLGPLWSMPFQQFVYRQLMYLVVIQAAISALRGVRLRWQHIERTGDVDLAET